MYISYTDIIVVLQDPSWYPSLSSRQQGSYKTQEIDGGIAGGGEEAREGQGVSRQVSTESSSSDRACPPPRKRKRLTSSTSSREVWLMNILPGWHDLQWVNPSNQAP